jgi:hypothetical protein
MKRWGVPLLVAAAVGIGIIIGQDSSETPPPATTSTSVTPPLPDLAIISATVQRVADPDTCGGYTLCLFVTVANWGSVDATGLDDGCGTASFGDPQPWTDFILDGVVPADTTLTFRSGYEYLGPHLPATFTLFCEIDAPNRVEESNE